jgi:hypothetical protein
MLELSPDSQAREYVWCEQLKLCAARYVWPRRKQKTPSLRWTWEQWWEFKFSDNYKSYVAKMGGQNNANADSNSL